MIKRMWVNAPSTLQALHKYHGQNVLYDDTTGVMYFTSGPRVSLKLHPVDAQMALNSGWVPVPWYKSIPKDGVVCWVSNRDPEERRIVDVVVGYLDGEEPVFNGITGIWVDSIPVKPEEHYGYSP